jgi:hypothetical protein
MKRISGNRFAALHTRYANAALGGFRSRRGAFLVIAMVCLVLAMMLVAAVLKLVESQRRQMRMEQAGLQAEWLAESGCHRAAAQLAADRNYRGETWSIAPADLAGTGPGGADAGSVEIKVRPVDGEPKSRVIQVEAVFPADSEPSARRTRRATIILFEES